ncbi:MAG: hypothetical protein R3Y08_04015 [Rikenellaceae bacterium]
MLSSSYPARALDAQIDTYVTNKPECKYTEIAIIKYDSGFGGETDIETIKAEARKIGADAIIITGSAGVSSYAIPMGNMSYVSSEASGTSAVAIKYKD